jgi:flagellar biogenesis protein FliO
VSFALPLAARALAALGLILAALFVIQAVVRRGGLRRPVSGRSLRLAESLFLPEGASLHLIEVGVRRYLIGRAAGGVNLLAEISAPAARVDSRVD